MRNLRREDNPYIIGVAVGPAKNFAFMEEYTDFYSRVDVFGGLQAVVQDVVQEVAFFDHYIFKFVSGE